MPRTPEATVDTTRRLPKRIVPLTLPAPYDDFHVTCWINAPRSLWLEAQSGDEQRTAAALQQIVLDHDLVDFDGVAYAPAASAEFWEQIPTEVGIVIIQAIQSATGVLSKVNGATP